MKIELWVVFQYQLAAVADAVRNEQKPDISADIFFVPRQFAGLLCNCALYDSMRSTVYKTDAIIHAVPIRAKRFSDMHTEPRASGVCNGRIVYKMIANRFRCKVLRQKRGNQCGQIVRLHVPDEFNGQWNILDS